jgi:hypothetical protein
MNQEFPKWFGLSLFAEILLFTATDAGFRLTDIVVLHVHQQKLIPIFPVLKVQIQSPPHIGVFVLFQYFFFGLHDNLLCVSGSKQIV